MGTREPLRILHCFRSPVGGIFRHVRDLVSEHAAAGHHIGILCDSTTGGDHEEALFNDIKPSLALGLHRIPIGRSISPFDFLALWNSYKVIQSLQPDILHGHGAKGGVIARLAGSILRVKRSRVSRFYSPHGGSLHYEPYRPSGMAVLALERLLEPLTDQLMFVCDFERQAYSSKVGVPRVAANVVYNGIPEREFRAIPAMSDAANFLMLGMLRDLKGPDVFIEAFQRCEQILGRPLSGLIVGDGQDRDKYDQMIRTRGLSRRLGLLRSMAREQAFERAPIVVVPSRAEAMPYIVIEALAAGKTLIASRVGGIPEVFDPQSPALVPPGDSEALAKAMVAALTHPDWRQTAMPDLETVRQRFSSETMARDILTLYTVDQDRLHGRNA